MEGSMMVIEKTIRLKEKELKLKYYKNLR